MKSKNDISQLIDIQIPPELVEKSEIINLQKSEVVFLPNEYTDNVYVIESGFIKVYAEDDFGNKGVQALVGPGNIFPIIQAQQAIPSGVGYEAISDIRLVKFLAKDFDAALRSNLEFCYEILDYTIAQTIDYKYRVDNLNFNFASERVAYRLLLLAQKYSTKAAPGLSLPAITQTDLAQLVSLTREACSKAIKKFENAGAISYSKKVIIIHDVDKLLDELKNKIVLPPGFYELKSN